MGVAFCPEEYMKKKRQAKRSVQSTACKYPFPVASFIEIEPQAYGDGISPLQPQFSEELLLRANQITKSRKTHSVYDDAPAVKGSAMVPFARQGATQQPPTMQDMCTMVGTIFSQMMGNAATGDGRRQDELPLTFFKRTSSQGSLPDTPPPKAPLPSPASGSVPTHDLKKRSHEEVDEEDDDGGEPEPALKKPAAGNAGPKARKQEVDAYIKEMLEETDRARGAARGKAKAKAKGKAKAKAKSKATAKASPTSTSNKAPLLPALTKQHPISCNDYAIYTDEKNSKWRVKKAGAVWDKMFSWGAWGAYGGDVKKAWKAVIEWVDGDKGNW